MPNSFGVPTHSVFFTKRKILTQNLEVEINFFFLQVHNNKDDLHLAEDGVHLNKYFSENYPEDPIHKQILHDFTNRLHMFPKNPVGHHW